MKFYSTKKKSKAHAESFEIVEITYCTMFMVIYNMEQGFHFTFYRAAAIHCDHMKRNYKCENDTV